MNWNLGPWTLVVGVGLVAFAAISRGVLRRLRRRE
jgi:hypothetical protein